MDTTTNMTPEWIAQTAKAHPPTLLDNGNIRVFGRLAFVNLLDRPKDKKTGKDRAWGCVVLLPEETDLKVLKDEAKALFQEKAPLALTNPAVAKRYHNPFKKQEEQVDKKTGQPYAGFVPGRTCLSANSPQSQPPVVNQRLAPIVDKARVFSGCWALVAVRPSWFKQDANEGPTFYLQSVMVVAEDQTLGGSGSADPNTDFAGISITGDVNPADAFGTGATDGQRAADKVEDIFA